MMNMFNTPPAQGTGQDGSLRCGEMLFEQGTLLLTWFKNLCNSIEELSETMQVMVMRREEVRQAELLRTQNEQDLLAGRTDPSLTIGTAELLG